MIDRLIDGVRARRGVRFTYLPTVSSTNDVAREEGYGDGDLIVADYQTAGRGQRGNGWESAAGENLTFSLVLEPDFLPAERQFYLSKAVSVALSDLLIRHRIAARIKWPNDIYVGDRKIVGTLIEHDVQGAMLSRSIAGIGLNVNQTEFGPMTVIPTSMRLETGIERARLPLLDEFYHLFNIRYRQLRENDLTEIDRVYHERLYRRDELCAYRLPGGASFRGTIRSVAPSGELLLEHEDGTVCRYLFKEVEYVIPR